MPNKSVASYGNVMLNCEVQDSSCIAGELRDGVNIVSVSHTSLLIENVIRLELVLGSDAVEMLEDEVSLSGYIRLIYTSTEFEILTKVVLQSDRAGGLRICSRLRSGACCTLTSYYCTGCASLATVTLSSQISVRLSGDSM